MYQPCRIGLTSHVAATPATVDDLDGLLTIELTSMMQDDECIPMEDLHDCITDRLHLCGILFVTAM